jgi:hypothetical protein
MAILTPDQVRLYIRDQVEYNRLIDELEFTDERISFAMDMTLAMFNMMSPVSQYLIDEFPNKYLFLIGTLHQLFLGEAAMAARNQMSYSDGGLTIPIEERYEYYMGLATTYGTQFQTAAQQLKITMNIEGGWGNVGSDYARFPSF